MSDRRFGVSTHLFHDHLLTREHLVHVAAHGFEAIELFATRSHFDYRSEPAVQELAQWLSDLRLELHSVHAPAFEAMRKGQWVGPYSNAATDDVRRQAALAEAQAALAMARHIPFKYLVVHLGVPTGDHAPGRPDQSRRGQPDVDNHRDAARRSVEALAEMAQDVGVRVALEVMPNPLSSAEALAELIEEHLDGVDVGVCLDYGHAHLMGDLGDAIETLSGHLWTTHVHDNRGKRDEHLVPFAGSIDWAVAMMATQKIGYDGMLMLEVGDAGDPVEVLKRSMKARERLEQMFVTFDGG